MPRRFPGFTFEATHEEEFSVKVASGKISWGAGTQIGLSLSITVTAALSLVFTFTLPYLAIPDESGHIRDLTACLIGLIYSHLTGFDPLNIVQAFDPARLAPEDILAKWIYLPVLALVSVLLSLAAHAKSAFDDPLQRQILAAGAALASLLYVVLLLAYPIDTVLYKQCLCDGNWQGLVKVGLDLRIGYGLALLVTIYNLAANEFLIGTLRTVRRAPGNVPGVVIRVPGPPPPCQPQDPAPPEPGEPGGDQSDPPKGDAQPSPINGAPSHDSLDGDVQHESAPAATPQQSAASQVSTPHISINISIGQPSAHTGQVEAGQPAVGESEEDEEDTEHAPAPAPAPGAASTATSRTPQRSSDPPSYPLLPGPFLPSDSEAGGIRANDKAASTGSDQPPKPDRPVDPTDSWL
jgi:hypothetical protein